MCVLKYAFTFIALYTYVDPCNVFWHGRIWVHCAARLHGYRKVAHFSCGLVNHGVLPWCPSGLGQGSKLAAWPLSFFVALCTF